MARRHASFVHLAIILALVLPHAHSAWQESLLQLLDLPTAATAKQERPRPQLGPHQILHVEPVKWAKPQVRLVALHVLDVLRDISRQLIPPGVVFATEVTPKTNRGVASSVHEENSSPSQGMEIAPVVE